MLIVLGGLPGVGKIQCEVVCTSSVEHRRRVEQRHLDESQAPTWAEVQVRDYRRWPEADHVLDPAGVSAAGYAAALRGGLGW